MIKKLLCFVLIGFTVQIFSQAGTLDTTFGGTGKVLTAMSTSNDEAHDLAVQSDGKIVVAGLVSNGSTNFYDFGVVRYNSDGTLDTMFATAGKLIMNISGYDMAYAVEIAPDGKIYVAGLTAGTSFYSGGNFSVVRLNTNGTLDTTFGTSGVATVTFPYTDYFTNLYLQNDGKILVCGRNVPDTTGNYSDFSLARFNNDGTLDFDFSNDGKLTTNFGNSDESTSIGVDTSGNIYLAGKGGTNVCIAKYFSDGSLDTSYATGGKVNLYVNNHSTELNDMKLLSDGSILFTGLYYDTQYQMIVGKLNPNGALDTTFGTNGITVTDVDSNSEDTAYSLVVQPDGKIIISGRTYTAGTYYFAVLRYTAAGVLDTTFSNDGKVLTAFGTSWGMAYSSVLQSDGKLLVAGQYGGSSNADFAIARYITLSPSLANTDFIKNKVSLYPNPTLGQIQLASELDLVSSNFSINDLLGKTLLRGILNQADEKIDVSSLSNGIYLFSIPEKSVAIKFIKY